jgi:hypothetical protein
MTTPQNPIALKSIFDADVVAERERAFVAHTTRLESSIVASLIAGTHECNACDLPVTHPNPAGYCDECLAEAGQ